MLFASMVTLMSNSCKTGFSKETYVAALERFVTSVEQDYQSFDETDWQYADERMIAFNEDYDKYADKFTSEERIKVSKLMSKYNTIRAKARVSGVFQDISDIIDIGIGTVEGVLEGITMPFSDEEK